MLVQPWHLLTFSPGVRCMNTCNVCVCVCLKIHPSDMFWGGVLAVLMSAVCLPVLLVLMKEVQGEWLKIGDYLHYSCVIVEKTWTLNSFFFTLTLAILFANVAWRCVGIC